MKRSFLAIIVVSSVFLFACKKDSTNPGNNNTGGVGTTTSIRYEFSADVSGAYKLTAQAATWTHDETISGSSWSKTITSPPKTAATDTAYLIVYAPDSWQNTPNQANVTLKIFVNNAEKASRSFVLVWIDRSGAFQLKTAY